MKLIPILVCLFVAFALPACTTAKKEECKTSGSCCAKDGMKKHR